MKARAALLLSQPGKWHVAEIDVDPPGEHEVLIRMAASGLCHSDEHFATGDISVGAVPFCGGHEGAGVVEAVGPGVTRLSIGDHIVTSFVPACGCCRWCASGKENLCENGAFILNGTQLDGTHRLHLNGAPVAQGSLISTFSELSVMPEWSCVKIDTDIPLGIAALLGCGVPTGWGSAVSAARTAPGDVVVVMGVGGVGANAVQGARMAGARHVIAVDPVEFKRDTALDLGATETYADLEEAADFARSVTDWQGADSAIITVGVLAPRDITAALAAIRKDGIVVVTSSGPTGLKATEIDLFELTMFEKRVQGALYGGMNPHKDVNRLLGLWRNGMLKLEELVSQTYRLTEINAGFDDLNAGRNIRGVIDFSLG